MTLKAAEACLRCACRSSFPIFIFCVPYTRLCICLLYTSDERLTPFYPQFIRELTKEDILKLLDIKMARILKFNKDKADENIARIKEQIEEINNHLAHIVEYTLSLIHI